MQFLVCTVVAPKDLGREHCSQAVSALRPLDSAGARWAPAVWCHKSQAREGFHPFVHHLTYAHSCDPRATRCGRYYAKALGAGDLADPSHSLSGGSRYYPHLMRRSQLPNEMKYLAEGPNVSKWQSQSSDLVCVREVPLECGLFLKRVGDLLQQIRGVHLFSGGMSLKPSTPPFFPEIAGFYIATSNANVRTVLATPSPRCQIRPTRVFVNIGTQPHLSVYIFSVSALLLQWAQEL